MFDQLVAELGLDLHKEYGPERLGEQVTSALDYSKAKRILGWEPTVDFAEGVKKTVEWFKKK